MPDAVIIGAGGLGREVYDIYDAAKIDGSTDLNLIGIIDDDPDRFLAGWTGFATIFETMFGS